MAADSPSKIAMMATGSFVFFLSYDIIRAEGKLYGFPYSIMVLALAVGSLALF